ncbi:hypothetical protein GIB67_034031 [Kingdonia uniflora]|uniref:Gag1-like clamp domain-containing protein n=1 Tax=Kingdonia uniflora TaxID=39325 RepID=A0A7J7M664_9MAGN|nr:hypothetical protein GIB67_034031 [Kingdonia uniflora]
MNSGCVGSLAKSQLPPSEPSIDRKLRYPSKRTTGKYSSRRRQWSSSSEVMENYVNNFHSHNKQPSAGQITANEERKLGENNANFVNQAARAWHEERTKWIGDQSQKLHRTKQEPVISPSTTYDNLLLTNRPFPDRIPLPEMVDFLVDIWQDEGLYY